MTQLEIKVTSVAEEKGGKANVLPNMCFFFFKGKFYFILIDFVHMSESGLFIYF